MNGVEDWRLSKIVFLGTGTSQGVPVIGCQCEVCRSLDIRDHRLRTSIALEGKKSRVVVDTGPDFREQMLREGMDYLDGVVYTHEHKDHLAGMDDVRPFNFLQKQPIVLRASERVEAALRRDFYYAFDDHRHGGVPHVQIERVCDFEGFEMGEMTWEPLPVMHGTLPIHGYRVDNVAYITDANEIPGPTLDRLAGLDILIVNALRHEVHYSHFSLGEALEVASQVAAKKTYLTHVSHLMGKHESIQSELPEGVALAHDGLVLMRHEQGWHEEVSDWTTTRWSP